MAIAIPTAPGCWPTNLTFAIDLWQELAKAKVLSIKVRDSASGHNRGALCRGTKYPQGNSSPAAS